MFVFLGGIWACLPKWPVSFWCPFEPNPTEYPAKTIMGRGGDERVELWLLGVL